LYLQCEKLIIEINLSEEEHWGTSLLCGYTWATKLILNLTI